MKQEHINPFIETAGNILEQMTQVPFKMGAATLRKEPFLSEDVLVSLGIVGDLKGRVIFSTGRETAKFVASSMMMGMPLDELSDMAKSALCELGNMIMGNVATLLFNQGVQIDITPPTLLTGSNIEVTATNMVTISIPLEADEHKFVINVSVKED